MQTVPYSVIKVVQEGSTVSIVLTLLMLRKVKSY